LKASVADLEFRNLTEDQLESYIDIVARSRVNHPFERRHTQEEAKASTFKDPDFDPEGSWLAYLNGEAVGFSAVLIEKNRIAAGMNDGYVDIDVVPEHRGKGVEDQLLARAIEHLRSRKMEKARARCYVTDTWRSSLLKPNSFKEEYRVYFLTRRGRSEVGPAEMPEGYRLVRKMFTEFSDEEMVAMVEAFNDSFRDHFDFASEPVERWMNFRDVGGDPIMISLVMEGDLTVGVCMSEESKLLNEERGVRTGWVNVLGVRPQHRRKGLARAMIADSLDWILGRGVDTIHIGVFAKNEKALDLYLSFGFERDVESIWYSRVL